MRKYDFHNSSYLIKLYIIVEEKKNNKVIKENITCMMKLNVLSIIKCLDCQKGHFRVIYVLANSHQIKTRYDGKIYKTRKVNAVMRKND